MSHTHEKDAVYICAQLVLYYLQSTSFSTDGECYTLFAIMHTRCQRQ